MGVMVFGSAMLWQYEILLSALRGASKLSCKMAEIWVGVGGSFPSWRQHCLV